MTWDAFWEHVRQTYANWPTPGIVAFEVAVVASALLTYWFLRRRVHRLRGHFILVAISVFLLEFFTGPMWQNRNLGFWAYVYSDVSWIYTLGWTSLIILVVYLIDVVVGAEKPWRRFAGYLLLLTPIALVFDAISVGLGIRVYSPEVLEAAGPARIPVLDVPLAGLYYIPVFMTLALSSYKHWLSVVEPAATTPARLPLLPRLVLTTLAVFLFEIVVEPMATNRNFPSWSYIYRDITVIMTGFWVVLVTVCTMAVDRILPREDFRYRFAASLGLITLIATPVEGWFIQSGYRVYGPSATADFLGFRTIIGDIPIEVMAAIPLYLSLVIAFVRYWDGSVNRQLGMRRQTPDSAEAPAGVPAPVAM